MSEWSNFAEQAASSLLGTLAGGAITVLVARWQTAKTLQSQSEVSAAAQIAAAQLARDQRERERSTVAAQHLLAHLADFSARLPSLPDVGSDSPRLSSEARDRCSAAMEALRRDLQTDLLSINEPEIRDRYRTVVKLAYDVAWRNAGRQQPDRVVRDVRNYLRYVQDSLDALIDDAPLPRRVLPPTLDREGSAPWRPPAPPWQLRDPADES